MNMNRTEKKTIHIYLLCTSYARTCWFRHPERSNNQASSCLYTRIIYNIYIYIRVREWCIRILTIYIRWRARFIYQWQGERCALPPASRTRGVESGGGVSPLARALLCPRRRSVAAAYTAVFPRGIAGGRPAETRCRLQNTGSPINRSHYKISYMKIYTT